MAIGNLCLALAELGLYRRAYRQGQALLDLCRDTGARLNQTLQQGGMLGWLIALGELDTRTHDLARIRGPASTR